MPIIPVDTAVQIMVGPLIDDTDNVSRETGVAYNAAGMDIDLLKSNDAGTPTSSSITLTSGGANDWAELSGGYYYIELTAVQNNTKGKLKIIGIANGIMHFESEEYDVVPTDVYNGLVGGTDYLQVDVRHWADSAVAAVNTAGTPVVDVTYVSGTAQTANDNGADINTLLTDLTAATVTIDSTAVEVNKIPRGTAEVSGGDNFVRNSVNDTASQLTENFS